MEKETELKSKVPGASAGQSLTDYLSKRFRYLERDVWMSKIREGKVTLNDSEARPDAILKAGDWVAYRTILRENPVNTDIRVVHDEEAFLVADKPGQLPSHADGNFILNTFYVILSERYKAQGYEGRLYLAHRLDRETSGLLVVAKTNEALRRLMMQFTQGTVEKEYLAVVRGVVREDRFTVDGAIGQDTKSAISIRRAVVPAGTPGAKVSRTEFEVIQRLRDATLVRIVPKSGRTNQIRVHLTHAGYPLVGDKLYGRTDKEYLDYVHYVKAGGAPGYEGKFGAERQLLHAAMIRFDHPVTRERVTFEASLPEDMAGYIRTHS